MNHVDVRAKFQAAYSALDAVFYELDNLSDKSVISAAKAVVQDQIELLTGRIVLQQHEKNEERKKLVGLVEVILRGSESVSYTSILAWVDKVDDFSSALDIRHKHDLASIADEIYKKYETSGLLGKR